MCFGKKKKDIQNSKTGVKISQKSPISSQKAVKLVLCGNAAVGKTSITARYRLDSFEDTHEPTLAGVYQQKKVKVKSGEQIKLNIWDTAGDERFKSIMPLYYRDAEIALLVFDLIDRVSFDGIDYWLEQLQSKAKTSGMVICLVGNKKDLVQERQVSKQQGFLKAHQSKCLYHQTSALTGEGINELFERVLDEYCKKRKS